MSEPGQRDEVVFEAALQLPGGERAAYLDKACAGDPGLRQRVEALLGALERAGGFLENPVVAASLKSTVLSIPLTEKPGDRIGRYKLLQEIGEGGCGVVYMAEQEEPVRRRVALKVIKLGMDTKQVIARFEAERQALALMDHPNIAKVLDAGATETGRPYFVMELVRGVKITDYCDQNNLPTRERLTLFTQVCQAIQHAHQKGIIHRDIKPSNILVTVNDGVPVPKVIDFGIAKATTGQQLTDKTLFTAFEQFIGTPAYMSPEQAEMTSLDIDTRSDIYALGVLLYELLTGKPPFDAQTLVKSGLDEMRRTIREVEPPKPSTRLNTLPDADLTAVAKHRGAEAAKLSNLVRGDLDWIVMKALEKDRTRRYETANGLAMDIQRHLDNEPVIARPPNNFYRFQKLVRRNKLAFGALTAIATVLVLGVVVSTWQAIRATRAEREQIRLRQQAETEAARSQQTAQFLKDTLRAAGPRVARGRDATLLREILDKTAGRVEKELKTQPEVRGDLWFTLGITYNDISDFERAIPMYQHAVESYRLALGNQNIKLALALARLGSLQCFTGDVSAGRPNAQLALDMARKIGDRQTLATCLYSFARSLGVGANMSPEGEPFLREAIALWKQLDTNPIALADCACTLAACLDDARGDEKESLAREALALHRQHLEPDHPAIADDLWWLGYILLRQGRLEEAETILRETVDRHRMLYDVSSSYQPRTLQCLVKVLVLRGKGDEAESLVRHTAEAFPSNARYWELLGEVQAYRGQWPAALEQFLRIKYTKAIAIALLKTGRIEEYRQLRHEQLVHGTLERALLLLPVDGADLELLRQLPDALPTTTPVERIASRKYLDSAMTEYRRGRFDASHQWAKRAVSDGAGSATQVQGYLIQALSSAQLKQMDAARAALAKADALIDQPGREYRDGPWWDFEDWQIAEILRREAADLLHVTEPKS